VAGIVLTVLLALWGTDAAHLTGDVDETARLLASRTHIDLQTLLTCGMVIAGLGVLNDVTITQASSVWELHAATPLLSRTRLFTGGMRIGRDHIASTVYTLAFAYAGTALPLILAAAPLPPPRAGARWAVHRAPDPQAASTTIVAPEIAAGNHRQNLRMKLGIHHGRVTGLPKTLDCFEEDRPVSL